MDITARVDICRINCGLTHFMEDKVVKEYLFTLYLNGEEVVTLLCSPSGLDYLTVGFLLSEDLIKKKEDILSIDVDINEGAAHVYTACKQNTSEMFSRGRILTSGFGKGTIFNDPLDALKYKVNKSVISMSPNSIFNVMEQFNKYSSAFLDTGGIHSSCISCGKEIVLFQEDIGRHNALDKIMGEACLKEIPLYDKVIVTSGRISSEMLIKCAKRSIPMIISRSAPTEMAIRLARQLNMTLIGFARGTRMNIYCGDQRILM